MAMAPDELYKADFYAWTRDQAASLRELAKARWNGPLDLDKLAEEVEELGTNARNAVRSQVQLIIEHALKLEYSGAIDPRRGWMNSIDDARDQIEDALTPQIRLHAEAMLERLYRRATRKAGRDLAAHGEQALLPDACPYALDDLLGEAWFPKNRHGLVND